MDPSGRTECLEQVPAGRGFCRSARLPWDVGKNAASNQSDAASRLPLFRCGRDWPPRRYGGPERIRGVAQQVERGSYLLFAFFLSLSIFLTFSFSFCFSLGRTHEATTIAKCGCVCRADYRRRRCRTRLSDLSAFPSAVSPMHPVH